MNSNNESSFSIYFLTIYLKTHFYRLAFAMSSSYYHLLLVFLLFPIIFIPVYSAPHSTFRFTVTPLHYFLISSHSFTFMPSSVLTFLSFLISSHFIMYTPFYLYYLINCIMISIFVGVLYCLHCCIAIKLSITKYWPVLKQIPTVE